MDVLTALDSAPWTVYHNKGNWIGSFDLCLEGFITKNETVSGACPESWLALRAKKKVMSLANFGTQSLFPLLTADLWAIVSVNKYINNSRYVKAKADWYIIIAEARGW